MPRPPSARGTCRDRFFVYSGHESLTADYGQNFAFSGASKTRETTFPAYGDVETFQRLSPFEFDNFLIELPLL